jgi:hypothetical protein
LLTIEIPAMIIGAGKREKNKNEFPNWNTTNN